MRPRRRLARLAALLGVLALLPACEKSVHEAARRDFHEIVSRALPPAARAKALEEFVDRYPEPKTNGNLVRACVLLAEHQAREGRGDLAASWYERALRAAPGDPDLMNSAGYFYATHGIALDRAVSLLEAAARIADERGFPARRKGFIRDSLGWAYRARGDLARAEEVLEEANRLAPGVAVIREHLAEAARARGEREKSAALYLDLYLEGRATDARLKGILLDLDREGGGAGGLGMAGRIEAGRRAIAATDRREAVAEGGTLLELLAEDGQRLRGTLFLPAGQGRGAQARPAERRPGVLLLHALGSSRHAAAPLARAVAARGLIAVTLDLRGHGESVSEEIPSPRRFSEALSGNLAGAAKDVAAALALLDHHPRIDPARIGAVGAGAGGLLAAEALAAAGRGQARGLVLLSPWGRPAAYQDPLARLEPAALLVVSGEEETAAGAMAEALVGLRGPGAPGPIVARSGGSGFDLTLGDPEVAARIVEFLAERLRP